VIPTLRTARTVLRELVPADAPALFAFRSDAEAEKHNDPALTDPREAVELIERLDADHRARGSVHWGLTLHGDDTVRGLLGYHHHVPAAFRAGLGYDLARPLWGRGLASEAVAAVLDWGFGAWGLNRVEAHTNAENHASVRMLERLGFWREGVFHDYFHEDGAFHDVALYVMLRRDRRP
jgi:[ribosomal protein S5]-alanine N-acetyltransferase